MKYACVVLCGLILFAGCATDGHESVSDKVLADFGLRERPEGYESGSDRVFQNLSDVGMTEIKRLNMESRQGSVKFEQDGMRGLYYREAKVFEDFHALDAQMLPRTSHGERGYSGYIEYSYRMFQSARKDSKVEAEAAEANIPTGESGREIYRYRFTAAGTWDGGKGERAKM